MLVPPITASSCSTSRDFIQGVQGGQAPMLGGVAWMCDQREPTGIPSDGPASSSAAWRSAGSAWPPFLAPPVRGRAARVLMLRAAADGPSTAMEPRQNEAEPRRRRERPIDDDGGGAGGGDEIWLQMRAEARRDAEAEPSLASFLFSTILAHRSLERALAFHLGNKLASSTLLSTQLFTMFVDVLMDESAGGAWIREAVRADMMAAKERDPACISYIHCMLNFKGFLACQAHRVSHSLWLQARTSLALALASRCSEVFHVDIHPAASIGRGVLFDHATGLVIGETATIGDNVSILHGVTLGGTGASSGDRHPKIADGVLIGAGAIVLGNVHVGAGSKVGAGSVVLTDVPPHSTVVGNPARLVKTAKNRDTPSETMDHTSFISTWSDYVI